MPQEEQPPQKIFQLRKDEYDLRTSHQLHDAFDTALDVPDVGRRHPQLFLQNQRGFVLSPLLYRSGLSDLLLFRASRGKGEKTDKSKEKTERETEVEGTKRRVLDFCHAFKTAFSTKAQ